MCSCEKSYTTAVACRKEAWWLYNVWFSVATTTKAKVDCKTMFRAHPEVLKGIREGKDIKILLYSKVRKATRTKMLAWRKYTQHERFNAFGRIFYAETSISPTFTRDLIFDCLGV